MASTRANSGWPGSRPVTDDGDGCRILVAQHPLQIDRLRVLRVVEGERRAHRGDERIDRQAALGGLGRGPDEALMTRQLAQRLASDAPDGVGQSGIAEAAQDRRRDTTPCRRGRVRAWRRAAPRSLRAPRRRALAIASSDEGVGDRLDPRDRPEVRGRGVTGVHREELALDVRRQVVDEVRARDGGRVVAERRPLDRPFEEGLDGDVDAAAVGLGGHDPVDRGVREHRAAGQRVPRVTRERDHLVAQQVGRVDRVLARHDLQGRRGRVAQRQAGDDVRGDELQDRRTDRGRDDVRTGDLVDDLVGVRRAVDRAEAGHDGVAATLADLVHGVLRDAVDRVDERSRDIGEHEFVSALVQQQSDEAAPDVARAEVDGLHQTPAADTSPYSSSGDCARLRFSTSSSSEKRIAICDRISRCSSPLPAMPTTNVTGSPPQSTPPS